MMELALRTLLRDLRELKLRGADHPFHDHALFSMLRISMTDDAVKQVEDMSSGCSGRRWSGPAAP